MQQLDGVRVITEPLDLEQLLVELSHVLDIPEVHQVVLQVQKFLKSVLTPILSYLVGLVIVEVENRHSVRDLQGERVHRVVDEQHITQVPIPDHPQILDVGSLFRLDTAFSEQPVRYPLLLRIQVVQHDVRIATMRRRKHQDLKMSAQSLQNLLSEGPHVHRCLHHFSTGEFYR